MKTTFRTVVKYVINDEMKHNGQGKVFNPKTKKWISADSAVTSLYRDFQRLWSLADNGNVFRLSQQGHDTELSQLEETFVFVILKQLATCDGPAHDIIKWKKKLTLSETENFIHSIIRQMDNELNTLPVDIDGYYDKKFDELLKISEQYWSEGCKNILSEIINDAKSLPYSTRLHILSLIYDFLDSQKKVVNSGGSRLAEF